MRSAKHAIPISVVASVFFWFGCEGVDLSKEQEVNSLRVLGVQAEPASLSPGEATRLTVICADGRKGEKGETEDPACDVEIAWFFDCDNPDKNDPNRCYDRYISRARALKSPIADTPEDSSIKWFHFGPSFEFVAPEDVLTTKVKVSGTTIRYGVSYIFFAVCAGRLFPANNATDRLPVECRARDSDKRLDQRDFVVGRTTMYSYDLIVNHNPEVIASAFDGVLIPPTCSDAEDCPADFECSPESRCIPVVETCSKDNPKGCKPHCFKLTLDPTSFHLFTVDEEMLEAPLKSLWYDYFTNSGQASDDNGSQKRALNDVDGTIRERTSCINWRAPTSTTERAHLWVVVRDDRGGLAVWDQLIVAR